MKLQLIKMNLLNFKGIRQLTVVFNQMGPTDILGKNGSGKSTIVDAFLWLWFGKDSSDRSDFNIKTLDKNSEAYQKLPHEVTAHMLLDDDILVLRKVYKEKWEKKSGSPEPEFKGHEVEYFWNNVPLLEKDFKAKISTIINEPQLKLLSNLVYFNAVLKWQDRRSALLSLAGGISDLEIANDLNNENGGYQHLISALMAKKTVDEYKKEIAAKIKKVKEDAEHLPARIDEAKRALPEEQDYEAIQSRINELNNDLANVESLLTSKSAAQKKHDDERMELIKEQNKHRVELISLENAIRNSVKDAKLARENNIAEQKRQGRAKADDRVRQIASRKIETDRKVELEKTIELLGRAWDTINAEQFTFDPNSCVCPTCKQDIASIDKAAKEEELRSNFNADKSRRLNLNAEKGKNLRADIDACLVKIGNLNAEIESLDAEISIYANRVTELEQEHTRLTQNEEAQVTQLLASDATVAKTKQEIESLQQLIDAPAPVEDKSEALQRKQEVSYEIVQLNTKMASKDQRAKGLRRIEDLVNQEAVCGQELTELEGLAFSLLQFDRAKMDVMEQRLNNKFKMVKFKLFNRHINGGEEPTCVTLIDGVPYSDANTASKINASLDIINVFSDHYGIKVPVFIDNRESVTEVIPTDLQLINLIVSPQHEELKVISESEMAFA